VSLRAKREQLMTERRLDKERKRREEKERKRQEAERLRQREREGQQDWKRYRAQRSQERRDDQRVKKLERLEVNWCEERVRIEARAREKRKEKVIRMLLWEKRKIDERTKELRDIKRAQDTKEARLALWEEWERKKSVWRRQEAFESGRKIFVGGTYHTHTASCQASSRPYDGLTPARHSFAQGSSSTMWRTKASPRRGSSSRSARST
jgi:hypothetical protein